MKRFAILAPLALLAFAGCSSKAQLVGSGGQCEVATDCQDGLACVPQKDGNRICTNDLSSVQKTPQMPAADSGAMVDASGDDGSTVTDAAPQDTSAPPQDSSQQDTSAPVDSATE